MKPFAIYYIDKCVTIQINYFKHLFIIKKKPSEEGYYKVPGDDLLSHASFPRSTIGAIGLNFRVRNGIGCNTYAIIAEEKLGN